MVICRKTWIDVPTAALFGREGKVQLKTNSAELVFNAACLVSSSVQQRSRKVSSRELRIVAICQSWLEFSWKFGASRILLVWLPWKRGFPASDGQFVVWWQPGNDQQGR